VATQLVAAYGQHRLSSADDDDDDVRSLNSFIVFDDPRNVLVGPQVRTPQKETRNEKKKRLERWRNLKDYGLVPLRKLVRDIENNMLCKCCVSDMLQGGSPVNVDVKDLGVKVTSTTSSFACLLPVQCRKNLHSYTIEPPRRDIPSSTKGKPGVKKRGRPVSTRRIRDFDITTRRIN